jgi:hypothetical protein
MKSALTLGRWLAVAACSVAAVFAIGTPKGQDREEILVLFEQRRVALAVPAGFVFSSGKGENGIITARLSDPKETVSLQISFLPDPSGGFSSARKRKEFIAQSFQHYVAGSVEQAMRFEELESRAGAGTYCVFTDASLAGKTKFPPNEYLHSTTGIKAWRGCFAVFTILSNSITSPEYVTVMNVVSESLKELPLTPLR